jgi:hypothetical protein
MSLRATPKSGEWVQVRSKEEILATLDKDGRLEGLPFMPEMFSFCGSRLQISNSAHKTCDPPNGLLGRRMSNAVHLQDTRCTGQAHGGCEAGCLLFWKEAWLQADDSRSRLPPSEHPVGAAICTEEDVYHATRSERDESGEDEPRYVCQSTQLALATQPLAWWDVRQYVEDYLSGNVKLSRMVACFIASACHTVAGAGLGIGTAVRWTYDSFQRARGGTPYPWRLGNIPSGSRTPGNRLDLQPGECVRVKSHPEILATLDDTGHNRGMWFDAEMVPYCGEPHRVLKRVNRIINEKTGHIQELKNDCIVLEGVVCRACYAEHRLFCPRKIFIYWREVWLERV